MIVAFSVGVGSGWILAERNTKKKFEAYANEEIESVKQHYAILRKEGSYSDPVKLAEEIIDKEQYSLDLDGLKGPQDPETAIEESKNVFDNPIEVPEDDELAGDPTHNFESSDPETYWSWDEELERRENEPDKPYVITLEEYMAGEKNYTQTALTYFDGDDVLADERDSIIEDIEATVGRENMLRFGHASNDRNLVYIRNDRIELDFEVVHSDGKYAEEVLGFVEHADKPKSLRKFRDYD